MKTKTSTTVKEIVSSEMQELMNYEPKSVIKNGNLLVLTIILMILIISWFIRINDVVRGSLDPSILNTSSFIISESRAPLQSLLVINGESIKQGQPIAFLQSNADHWQVIKLEQYLRSISPIIDNDSFELLAALPSPPFNNLGEIGEEYEGFEKQIKEILFVSAENDYRHKKRRLQEDLILLNEEMQKITANSSKISSANLNHQIASTVRIFERRISSKSPYLVRTYQIWTDKELEDLIKLLGLLQAIDSKRVAEIQFLTKSFLRKSSNIRISFFNLKAIVATWVHKYIIISPQSGMVQFTSKLRVGQSIDIGQILVFVHPCDPPFHLKISVSKLDKSKIKNGQQIAICIDHKYDNKSYNIVGRIKSVTDLDNPDGGILLHIVFLNDTTLGLLYDSILQQQLPIQVGIIVGQRRLFDKLLSI